MRLVAVSIVKNEADIIEAFVRHTLAWVNHHLIFDHDSTDGTRQILGTLKAEKLPITIYTDDELGNLQQARSNHLTRLAADVHGADWVLPLDADEILTGQSREHLEAILATKSADEPVSVFLLNYYPTKEDNPAITNPVLRLRYCQTSLSRTKKIIIPRPLALDQAVLAGKGSHALYRGQESIADQPLPETYHLCHLALRSPEHQALRVVLAELQKLSRGKAHEGLDIHYRLGFQLLAEDPDLFFSTVCLPVQSLQLKPIEYRGAAVCSDPTFLGWNRASRALLPYLEKLATSHGRMVDSPQPAQPSTEKLAPTIRELRDSDIPALHHSIGSNKFSGFVAHSGWGPTEGPVPEAFLPPFHWGYAPTTNLIIKAATARQAQMSGSALTYSEAQTISVELNGIPLLQHSFSRTNQKESFSVVLNLQPGENHVIFRYSQHLTTDYDSRQLAVIYLSLQIEEPSEP